MIDFEAPRAHAELTAASLEAVDALDYGVIRMTTDGTVVAYNRWETALSGLSAGRVLGRNFFTEVAPCTNNYLVADRMRAGGDLDARVAYIFSVRMRPTAVTLRLLRSGDADMFMLVRTE